MKCCIKKFKFKLKIIFYFDLSNVFYIFGIYELGPILPALKYIPRYLVPIDNPKIFWVRITGFFLPRILATIKHAISILPPMNVTKSSLTLKDS
jgi:hypothetical protein